MKIVAKLYSGALKFCVKRKISMPRSIACLIFLIPFFLHARDHANFVVFSPPKSGTHLIAKVLELMLKKEAVMYLGNVGEPKDAFKKVEYATKENRFLIAHMYNPDTMKLLISRRYKVIFMVRDPRDLMVSALNWIREGQWPHIPAIHIANPSEQLDELITGRRFDYRFFDWAFGNDLSICRDLSAYAYIAHFENLVGPEGGGDRESQIKEIMGLGKAIGFKITKKRAAQIADEAFGGTGTFRNGQIGKWQEVFQPEHITSFKKLYGHFLINLGYEKNMDW